MESLLLNPAAVWLILNLGSSVIIGFTQSRSIIRPAALPLFVLYNAALLPTYLNSTHRKMWALIAAAQNLSVILQYFAMALEKQWDFESLGYFTCPDDSSDKVESKQSGSASHSVLGRLYFGYWCTFSSRLCGTPFEVKNVPAFFSKDPSCVPSKRQFFTQRLLKCLACYAWIDIATSIPADVEQNQLDFASANVALLRRLGNYPLNLLALRTIVTLVKWTLSYCVVELYMDLAAFVRVSIGLDDVAFWRPHFGSLGDAWNLRQFWGKFWHQHTRLKLSAPADFITFSVLRLRKGSFIARYCHLFLVFFASGIVHTCLERAQGLGWRESGALQFFLTQVVGILIEDSVQAAYRSVCGLKRDENRLPLAWARWLGYLWVAAFFVWADPVWTYPNVRGNTGASEDEILPFSFVRWLSSSRR